MADLHVLAVDAEKNLEQLATGLAQAGADQGTVQAVTKMAEVTRQIVKALGAGQSQTADAAPAAQPAPPSQPPPQAGPARPETMDSATAALHHSAQAAAHAQKAQQYAASP
jgi:hypothetical protein